MLPRVTQHGHDPEKDRKAGLLLKAPLVSRNFSGWNEAGPGTGQDHEGWSGAVRELWSPAGGVSTDDQGCLPRAAHRGGFLAFVPNALGPTQS